MNENSIVLRQKIEIIFKKLCNENISFLTQLLYSQVNIEEKAQKSVDAIKANSIDEATKNLFDNRAKLLKRWINGGNIDLVKFRAEFSDYDISHFSMQNKPLFTVDEFLTIDITSFENKIHKYQKWKQALSIDEDISYRYIYVYDEPSQAIDFYEVKYFESDSSDSSKVKIKIIPPKAIEKNSDIANYEGYMYFKQNTITLNIENDDDILMILFNKKLKSASVQDLYHNNLYGIAIGIDDHTKDVPKAKKVIFRQNKIQDSDLSRTYLLLNEMEILHANENIYNYEETSQLDIKHLKQYRNKISYIDTFLLKLLELEDIDIPLYHSLAFKEFHSIYHIFQKLVLQQDYYVKDRRRVFIEFLDSVKTTNATSCSMILPVFIKKSNVFLYDSDDTQMTIKEKVFNLSEDGVEINIIFVINSILECKDTDFFKILKEFKAKNIDIRFVLKDDVIDKVNSFDFFFDNSKHKYVITKLHKVNYKVFDVVRQVKNIKNHITDYKIIKRESLSYEELVKDKSSTKLNNPILNQLVGQWFYYAYGSYETHGSLKFWKTTIDIKSNSDVLESHISKTIKKGTINIENSQCLISLIEIENNDHSYISFDSGNIQQVFISMRYTKQHPRQNGYMVMVGIFSKEELSEEVAKKLLGDTDDLILKISPSMQARIDTFVVENYSYYTNER